jgi:hypothetical protein
MLNSPRIEQSYFTEREESVSESASFIDIESSISTSELNPWNLGGSARSASRARGALRNELFSSSELLDFYNSVTSTEVD